MEGGDAADFGDDLGRKLKVIKVISSLKSFYNFAATGCFHPALPVLDN